MINFSSDLTEFEKRETLLNHLAREAYKYGEFKLASGGKSNHYVNCKPVSLKGESLPLLSQALFECIEEEAVAVAGLTLGADPLVSGVIIAAAFAERILDGIIVRKEAKGHGTEAWLEGPLPTAGGVITVLEDVVTTGQSSLKAVNQLRKCGYCVKRVVSIVDRQEGGEQAMKKEGLDLISLFQLSEIANRAKAIKQK
tara:strand:+ start:153 stop:746 length:594 start_codon:yes stop_codon:yes gene_type:complete